MIAFGSVLSRRAALTVGATLVLAAVAGAQSFMMNVPIYGQRWSPWASDRLGWTQLLIKDYGCALTSSAMLARWYGAPVDPRSLNEWLKQNGGYSGAAIIWNKVAQRAGIRFTGFYNWQNVPANLSVINAELNAWRPVIVETRLNGTVHFVILIGRSGPSGYYMNDPFFGDRLLFNSRYGDPARWIYGARTFAR